MARLTCSAEASSGGLMRAREAHRWPGSQSRATHGTTASGQECLLTWMTSSAGEKVNSGFINVMNLTHLDRTKKEKTLTMLFLGHDIFPKRYVRCWQTPCLHNDRHLIWVMITGNKHHKSTAWLQWQLSRVRYRKLDSRLWLQLGQRKNKRTRLNKNVLNQCYMVRWKQWMKN